MMFGNPPHGAASQATIHIIFQVDPNVILELDWLRFLLSGFELKFMTDQQHQVVADQAIIVTTGEAIAGISVQQYLQKFRQQGFSVGVIHLSDEWFTAPIDFYTDADFVFRNHYREEAMRYDHVYFFPLGYTRDLEQFIHPKPTGDRPHRWSFAGALRGKISRRQMLANAKQIPGGVSYIGNDFYDLSNLNSRRYAELMCDTVFALSPGGNRSVETFRIYEALEAGAIPIVEDTTKLKMLKGILKEIVKPKSFLKHQAWTWRYWQSNLYRLQAPSYWLQAFGPEFPCPRCRNWDELPQILNSIEDIEAKATEVRAFWQRYKRSLLNTIQTVVGQSFFADEQTADGQTQIPKTVTGRSVGQPSEALLR